MEITIENAGQFSSVRLYGNLDSQGAGSVYDTIVGFGSTGPGHVVLHLGAVTSATRAGCRVIFVAAKLLQVRTGEKMLICDAPPNVAQLLRNAGFAHCIEILETSSEVSQMCEAA